MTDTIVPPHSLEAEEYVVAACLLGQLAPVERVADVLEVDHFYRRSLGVIFDACCVVRAEGAHPDPVVVADHLRKTGELDDVGGIARLAELAAIVPTTANIERYAEIIVDMHFAREQLASAQALMKVSMNGGLAANPDVQARIKALLEPASRGAALEALDLATILSGPVPKITWSWDSWIAHDDLALVVGDAGVGKSFLTLALALKMREGKEFLGNEVMERRCGIVDLENPYADVLVRLHSLGLRHEDTDGISYFHMPYLNLTHPSGVRTVESTIVDNHLGLIVLDSFRRLCPGVKENDSGEVTDVLQPLVEVARRRGCNIVVIHHAKKQQEHSPMTAADLVRGSSAFRAVCDVQLFLRSKPGVASAFTLEHGKNRHGPERQPIQVHIEQREDGAVELVSGGDVATADDKVDRWTTVIVEFLAVTEYGATRAELASAVGTSPASREFRQALKLAMQRGVVVEHKKARGAASAFVHVQHDRQLADGIVGESNVVPLRPPTDDDDAPPDDRPPLTDDDIPF